MMAHHHARANFFGGLSGIQLPVPKYQFPPAYQAASRLEFYAAFFNSIEINSSFYKLPMPTTVSRWASSVPENFRFTFKLLRDVTHCGNLLYDEEHVAAFMDVISHAGERRGCVLVQFPPGLMNDHIHQLDHLLQSIRRSDPRSLWQVAVEFRYSGWYNDDVFDLLESHQATLVLHDIPKSHSPWHKVSSDVIYLRFHGPTGNYRGSYGEAFLHEHAGYIDGWLSEGRKVYVYFNNTAGDAFHNLRTLNKFLGTDPDTSRVS
jgi:uncharacterized protein YecE (DUF72 family)